MATPPQVIPGKTRLDTLNVFLRRVSRTIVMMMGLDGPGCGGLMFGHYGDDGVFHDDEDGLG